MIELFGADPEHVQDDLRVLRIVLVPPVVQRFPGPGESDRRDQLGLEPGLRQVVRRATVVVARRLERHPDGTVVFGNNAVRRSKLGAGVGTVRRRRRAFPAPDQDFVAAWRCRCLRERLGRVGWWAWSWSVSSSVWFVQNHRRDPRPGHGRQLRSPTAPQSTMASVSVSFRRCYGTELTSPGDPALAAGSGHRVALHCPGKPMRTASLRA